MVTVAMCNTWRSLVMTESWSWHPSSHVSLGTCAPQFSAPVPGVSSGQWWQCWDLWTNGTTLCQCLHWGVSTVSSLSWSSLSPLKKMKTALGHHYLLRIKLISETQILNWQTNVPFIISFLYTYINFKDITSFPKLLLYILTFYFSSSCFFMRRENFVAGWNQLFVRI